MLDGLTAAAQYSTPAITDVLLSWRKSGLAAANQQEKDVGPPAVVLRKRVCPRWLGAGWARRLSDRCVIGLAHSGPAHPPHESRQADVTY